ncbi:GIY-YIG nuclease family protein [Alloalcanivorax xenomutans]|uniref:GIY-YIG nuclease family protein n=1 Tax=Alloalcanivorax xenomutans TaxID=1094342 RepID=UPI003A7FB86C
MQQWWVYILCCVDGSLYTGVTTDVERRHREHNEGPRGARYTRARRPVTLVWRAAVADRASACRLEARIKAQPRTVKERLLAIGQSNTNDVQEVLDVLGLDMETPQ